MSQQITTTDASDDALATLATGINMEHALVLRKNRETVAHAARAGDLLVSAKRRLRHGEWIPWLMDNFDGSIRTAQVYMRIARHPEDAQAAAHLGLAAVADRITERERKRAARRQLPPPNPKSIAAQRSLLLPREPPPRPYRPDWSPWVTDCPKCGHDLYATLDARAGTREDAQSNTIKKPPHRVNGRGRDPQEHDLP